jgi:hypothetical protein
MVPAKDYYPRYFQDKIRTTPDYIAHTGLLNKDHKFTRGT